MNDPREQITPRERSARPMSTRRYVAGSLAVVALAIVAVAWFWSTPTPQTAAPQAVIVVGAGAGLMALVAAIRNMGLSDVLDLLCDLIAGLFSIVAAILSAIFLSMLGWD
jgi:hypothetical protein